MCVYACLCRVCVCVRLCVCVSVCVCVCFLGAVLNFKEIEENKSEIAFNSYCILRRLCYSSREFQVNPRVLASLI